MRSDAVGREEGAAAGAQTRTAGGRGGADRFDYTAVGHVTADVMSDGARRPGGGAFYSALQAARLGLRARIITRGVAEEIEELLAPYRGELAFVEVQPARETTTLTARARMGDRRQRILAWAGAMSAPQALDTAILHFAAVARETPVSWSGAVDFVGLTPQGLVRRWSALGEVMRRTPLEQNQLPARCEAIVISEAERTSSAALLRHATHSRLGAIIAITAQEHPTELRSPGGAVQHLAPSRPAQVLDDIGAGDVFAAAFFIALHDGAAAADAARFAHAAAAVRIAREGAAAIGDRAAIEAWLRPGASTDADAAREGDRSGPR